MDYAAGQTVYMLTVTEVKELTITKANSRSIYLSDGTRLRADGSRLNDYWHRRIIFHDRSEAERRFNQPRS